MLAQLSWDLESHTAGVALGSSWNSQSIRFGDPPEDAAWEADGLVEEMTMGEFSEIEKMFKGKKSRRIRNLSRLNTNKIGRITSNKMKPKDQEDPSCCQKAGHNQETVESRAGFQEVFATQRIKTRREHTQPRSAQLLLHTKTYSI